MPVSYRSAYDAYDVSIQREEQHMQPHSLLFTDPFQSFLVSRRVHVSLDGFRRMQLCRDALNLLDESGWQRSYHQRVFHDHFIRACSRVFFKTDRPGTFARAHQVLLELNSWDNLSQVVCCS